jgi:hypothetical protein
MKLRCLAVAATMATVGCGEATEGDEELGLWLAPVEDAPAPKPDSISFGRDTKERARGVGIRDQKHQHPKVIYSIRLPDLSSDETLRVRGEVTLSRCNDKDVAGESGDAAHTPCNSKHLENNPYGYAPRFSATFVLAASKTGANPNGAVAGWFDTTCPESRHHCALAIPEMQVDQVPDAEEKFLNLVVSADAAGKNARSWDVMEVEKDHGGLYVTRMAAGGGDVVLHESNDQLLASGKMGIDQTEDENDHTQVKRLVYQQRVDGLAPGDVVSASAQMHAVLDGSKGCDPLITSRLILTRNADALEPKQPEDVPLTAKNGANCADHGSGGCKYEKSGAGQVGNKAAGTMYVSLVAVALRSCAAPNGGDKWHVKPGGFIDVTVRR